MPLSKHPYDFDVAIIGGGSGGYAAARSAAGAGLKTVVIEGASEIGGLCILRGCMPTKAMLHAAEVRHTGLKSNAWGIEASTGAFDFRSVMARKDLMIEDFASFRAQQLQSGRFEFIRASARFQDQHTLELSKGCTLSASHFIISTGSKINTPPLPHLQSTGYITSDEAVRLTGLPESIIILGGGAIACEFAQFFGRFGVTVTLIQRSNQLLRDHDPDVAQVVREAFESEGIRVLAGTKLTGATKGPEGKTIHFDHQGDSKTIEADEIMHALGRSPNTASLGLDRCGVDTMDGRIQTNDQMQTTASHIYAAGDCTGPHEIVHIAIQQGEIAIHNILHPDRPKSMDYRLLTSVVFTDPQAATVGLTEKEATKRGVPFKSATYPFADHGKSMIMDATRGFVKLLANPTSGEIIGGACVGPMGGELIHEIVAAMHKRMSVQELAAMPHYHPTLAEIWTYPAEELASQIS